MQPSASPILFFMRRFVPPEFKRKGQGWKKPPQGRRQKRDFAKYYAAAMSRGRI